MAITQHAAVLGTFWKLIESYGKDPDPIFRKLYLDPKLAENPNARIPYAKIEAFWLEIIALIDDPGIGLKAAELWHPSSSGSLGYAWLASSSLRTAFVRLVRYLRVVTEGMQCRIEEKNGEFALIHAFHKNSLNIPQHADAVLATITSLCRINYGQSLQPVAVSFTHPEPADSGAYFAFFRCPVYFNTEDNRIILSQDAVNKRLPSYMIKSWLNTWPNWMMTTSSNGLRPPLSINSLQDKSPTAALPMHCIYLGEPSTAGCCSKTPPSEPYSMKCGRNWQASTSQTVV
jgi:Arabinose-binding domain of AraC transcription regulator, N-term